MVNGHVPGMVMYPVCMLKRPWTAGLPMAILCSIENRISGTAGMPHPMPIHCCDKNPVSGNRLPSYPLHL